MTLDTQRWTERQEHKLPSRQTGSDDSVLLAVYATTRQIITVSLFVFNDVSSFPANMQKLAYSLWRSLQASENSLVNAALASDSYVLSPVLRHWRCNLFF